MSYLYKDYFAEPKHKHDGGTLLQIGVPITFVSSFGVALIAPEWLWALLVYGVVMVLTWGTLLILWRKFEKREAVTPRNYYMIDVVRSFLTQWEKLDMDMRRELIDLYAGVYQLVKTGNQVFSYHDSTRESSDMASAIQERTKAVKAVVDEQTRLKIRLAQAGMVDLDSHAFETARLYAESFQQQAQELDE